MTELVLALLFVAAPAKAKGPQDKDPPAIRHLPVRSGTEGQDLRLVCEIEDASGVFGPALHWRLSGTPAWKKLPLAPEGEGKFAATIAGREVTGGIEYYLEAYDTAGNGPGRSGSPDDPLRVEVAVSAPAAAAPPAPESAAMEFGEAPAPTAEGPSRIGPLATIGAGAVLLGVGAVLWFGASSDAQDLRDRYSSGDAMQPADADRAAGADLRGKIGSSLLLAGLVAGGGGAAWLLAPQAPAQTFSLRIRFP